MIKKFFENKNILYIFYDLNYKFINVFYIHIKYKIN